MRRMGLILSLLSLTLFAAACGDEDEEVDARVSGPDASHVDAGGIDAGGGAGPMITMVAWTPVAGCTAGTASDFTITTTATPATGLTYSGMATSCTGTIDGPTATLNCPNLAAYPGSVTVTDAQGNSATQDFTIMICMAGTAP